MTATAQDIPNRFDFQTACSRIYELWEAGGYFHAEPNAQREPFSIVIPPPNVTGALHLGHALNNTLQDILIRMKRMQGFETLWMPGTDHAGIATQAVVERRLKEEESKTRHDLGRKALVKRIWDWKDQYEARIIEQLKSLGCSCDWERLRFTLDQQCATAVRATFFDLFRKDLIYRGKRLVNWDTYLQTAVSDDEVNNQTIRGHFWHFKYPVIDPRPGEPTFVTIATTRPETMLADTAVAVHPDPAAALAKVADEFQDKLGKAKKSEQAAITEQIRDIEIRQSQKLPELERLRQMAEDGRRLRLPLMNREIPLVTDSWAKPELGSGCVKITPAHDPNDYEVGKRKDLPLINILHPDGTLNAEAGKYEGLSIEQARAAVVEDLTELDLVAEVEDREIELPFSDRSKTPIEPLLADQWFVKMDRPAQTAMDAVTTGAVKIFPNRYAKSYLDWLGEKRDWPVSRQLWWGHQIPVWSRPAGDASELQNLQSEVAEGLKTNATSAAIQIEFPEEQDNEKRQRLGLPWATVHVCIEKDGDPLEQFLERIGFVREEDVLDTWFSSALWTHSTFGWPTATAELEYFYPTSTLITSRDIITLWVARMVLMGLNNLQQVPFHEVFIHPKILDGYGETMSKSKGNGIDPLDVIEKFGPDALRFSMAQLTTETQDVRMPVQFECPHCGSSVEQTRKNRSLPRVECSTCHHGFSTQWAESSADKALPRGLVISERFEVARNFGNKLWNAARFAMLNMEGYAPDDIALDQLPIEDRWILSRLATVTQQVTEANEHYRFSESAKALYDFAWDEFCSFYVEMLKERFADAQARPLAQRMVAHTLDVLLRLLHPIVPFITEEIWQMLAAHAPQRGLEPGSAAASLVVAPWPQLVNEHQDPAIETQFARFQATLGAVREIRSRQNVPPKKEISFYVRASDEAVRSLQPLVGYFPSMANAQCMAMSSVVDPPTMNATVQLTDVEVIVDLSGLIDKQAERRRLDKEKSRLEKGIEASQKKLANPSFVDNAPAKIVQREQQSLATMQAQLAAVFEGLSKLA